MSEQKKWAEKLSAQCSLNPTFLSSVVEELSESCYGDAKTSQDIISELTMSCHMNKDDLKRFIKEVSKNCPVDSKKLLEEVEKAEGAKEVAFQAANRAGTRGVFSSEGVR